MNKISLIKKKKFTEFNYPYTYTKCILMQTESTYVIWGFLPLRSG